eukprot:1190624-Prorocentrum_minimum.AAC.4
MRDFYTVRHNSVGRTLLHAMRQGMLGRAADSPRLDAPGSRQGNASEGARRNRRERGAIGESAAQ